MTDLVLVNGAIARMRRALDQYVFRARNEADLQGQVFGVLLLDPQLRCDREVVAARGRYDILVQWRESWADFDRSHPIDRHRMQLVSIVLELKVQGGAAAAERQAQKYAQTDGVDAVVIATTSLRLARSITSAGGDTLGGKPFAVIDLRVF